MALLPRALSTFKVNKKFNNWLIIPCSAVKFLPHNVKNEQRQIFHKHFKEDVPTTQISHKNRKEIKKKTFKFNTNSSSSRNLAKIRNISNTCNEDQSLEEI